ncbi:hypothetical protein vseg_016683 [Gypsophila vaccaria]
MATATTTVAGGASKREGTAKTMVSEQISQAIQSTSNLLHLIQHSSHSQAQLAKLPKRLMAKTDTIRNTGQVLQQLPLVISSLDAYTEHGLHSIPHLKTVSQLLENMESSQLKSQSQSSLSHERTQEA